MNAASNPAMPNPALPPGLSTSADWLAPLRAAAVVPPRRPRLPVWAGEVGASAAAVIGSVEAGFLDPIALKPNGYLRSVLSKNERSAPAPHSSGSLALPAVKGWQVLGDDLSASLGAIAAQLRAAGLAGAWRHEQLAVHDAAGKRVGSIERGAARPLGIATQAVHLVGLAPDGRCWVQQRALSKPNDPGLWDTLMGGMVSAADTLETALARETWEEAGLDIAALPGLRHGGQLLSARPSDEGDGRGYLRETSHWFCCTVPARIAPENQDGEVARFALMDAAEVTHRIQHGEFTRDAALILADALGLGQR